MQAKKEEWKMNHSVKRGPKTYIAKTISMILPYTPFDRHIERVV